MRKSNCFFISGYLMPPRTKAGFEDLKNSGLNHIYLDFTLNSEITDLALSFCDEYDINAIVMTCWSRYDNPSFESVTKNICHHKSFVGVNGLDEPIYEDFPSIFDELHKFNNTFSDKTFYVNMVNCNVPQKFIATDESIKYPDLVNVYKKLINEIKYDKTASMTIYPLLIDEETKSPKLHPKHLQSLKHVSDVALDTGAEMYFFVQTMPFRNTHRKPSLTDLYFQVNSGLAFGAKGVQYFCYRTPDPNWEFNESQYAMVLKDGTKTDIYYSVKKVNEWLTHLSSFYLGLKYVKTCCHKNNYQKESTETFEEFNSNSEKSSIDVYSTEDVLIGEFLTKNNKPAFFFVNYGEPTKQNKNYIEFSLKDKNINKVTVISAKGNYQIKGFAGVFSILLNKGEGLLVLTSDD